MHESPVVLYYLMPMARSPLRIASDQRGMELQKCNNLCSPRIWPRITYFISSFKRSSYSISYLLLETCLAKGILDILNETDNSTDEELLEYAMTLVNKVRLMTVIFYPLVSKRARIQRCIS